ncbi:MAG: hypothetical protein L0Y74_10985 [candidate division Zixibacteria bacterium]|nr:hypothetical protein [candidate division Zixibacteria bacterium]
MLRKKTSEKNSVLQVNDTLEKQKPKAVVPWWQVKGLSIYGRRPFGCTISRNFELAEKEQIRIEALRHEIEKDTPGFFFNSELELGHFESLRTDWFSSIISEEPVCDKKVLPPIIIQIIKEYAKKAADEVEEEERLKRLALNKKIDEVGT